MKIGRQGSKRKLAWLGCSVLAVSSVACGGSDDNASLDALSAAVPRETCSDNPLLAGCSLPSNASALPISSVGDSNGGAYAQASSEADVPSGDRYDAPGTNPFVMVAYDPLSTFAVDVDTASYDLFRRDVEDGRLPDPASVRLEEYVNYFGYDYAAADFDSDVPFSISLAAAPSSLDAERTLLRVGIAGKLPPADAGKRPTNLVFLVDVSGSMNASDRLPLAQQVLTQSLDLLGDMDTVSIVTYASDTSVRLPPTPIAQRADIAREIAELSSGGSTAGASGINLAYAQAQAGFIQGGINHVILCTDGDFNVGVSSTEQLLALIKEKRQTGVTFTALGFGSGNLNDAMLEAISNAGNGFYGVISSEEQAATYVDERLLSTLSLIARDMKVQVEFNPDLVLAYRLLGYENRALADQDFRDDIVDAGEIGAGHRVTALYELVRAGAELPATPGAPQAMTGAAYAGARAVPSSDLVAVKVRYKHPDAGTTDAALEVSSTLAPSAVAQSLAQADADLAWQSSVAAFSEILKGSPYANAADLDALGAVFEAQSAGDADRAEFYELFTLARELL